MRYALTESVCAGTPDNPIPRIKLVFLSDSEDPAVLGTSQHQALYDRILNADSAKIIEINDDTGEDNDDDAGKDTDADEDEVRTVKAVSMLQDGEQQGLLDKLYGLNITSTGEATSPGSPQLALPYPPANRFSEGTNGDSEAVLLGPDILLDEGVHADVDEEGLGVPCIDDHLLTTRQTVQNKLRRQRQRRREIIINLEYDSEFFTLLNQALTSLTALMDNEKEAFIAAVTSLAEVISKTASPTLSKQNDLYQWREVFSIWVEAQIFESNYELSRGERSVAEVESRLHWFVDQVGRRSLAKKMRHKTSRAALERFVGLNQELLELKRWAYLLRSETTVDCLVFRVGFANREAARKILKKHDKRLGLSASQGFPEFLSQKHLTQTPEQNINSSRSAVAQRVSSNAMTSLLFAGIITLPHVLLTTITDVLLPIVPQIDDYSCLICGDIAYRPITLDCGHRFCLRCLVKMQRRGQDACPSCRAPVVLKANKGECSTEYAVYSALPLAFFSRQSRQGIVGIPTNLVPQGDQAEGKTKRQGSQARVCRRLRPRTQMYRIIA